MVAGASEQPVELSMPDRVLNPDEVARSIDPINPDRIAIEAARAILRQRAELLNEGLDFAIETTLSGNGEMRLLKDARDRGYEIGLIYIATQNPIMNLLRVERRWEEQNRSVPAADVLRRFARSLAQLSRAVTLSDIAYIYDNTGADFLKLAFCKDGKVMETVPELPDWAERALKPQLDAYRQRS